MGESWDDREENIAYCAICHDKIINPVVCWNGKWFCSDHCKTEYIKRMN